MTVSAFGVEHGVSIAKRAPKTFDTSPGVDPEGYRQSVGSQLNPRSAKFHREGSLGRRSKRIARETAKGTARAGLKGAGIGAGVGAGLGAASGAYLGKVTRTGAAQTAKWGAAIGALRGAGAGGGIGGGIGSNKGMRQGRNQNIKAGDTASYRRGGKNKSEKSKGQNRVGLERYS